LDLGPHGVHDKEDRVGGPEAADHLGDEDAVARGVDQVELSLLPLERGDREADGDLPLDLLGVEIRQGAAVLDAAEAGNRVCLVKERGDELSSFRHRCGLRYGDVVDGRSKDHLTSFPMARTGEGRL
jgi:hypothetical protein